MAKNNEIAYKALNIGIVAAVIIGIYFLYTWLKKKAEANTDNNGGMDKVKPGTGDLLTRLADKAADDMKNVPHDLIVAIQLKKANQQAAKFSTKKGTNIIINKALKEVNALPDGHFIIAVKEWQALDNIDRVFDSPLALYVSTPAISVFLTRYGQLIGKIQHK